MACLKVSIGCLAVIGAVVIVLVLAVVGLFALGMHHMVDLPERAAPSAIEQRHGTLIGEVRRRLADPSGLRGWTPPEPLVAVRHIASTTASAADPDLLRGGPQLWASHTLINGGGIATIDRSDGPPLPCLLYELHQGKQIYWLYLADSGVRRDGPE